MGYYRPNTSLVRAWIVLLFLGTTLTAMDFYEEEWNPTLEMQSDHDPLFDSDLSMNEDYHFPSLTDESFNLFNIADETPLTRPFQSINELIAAEEPNPLLGPTTTLPGNATQTPGTPGITGAIGSTGATGIQNALDTPNATGIQSTTPAAAAGTSAAPLEPTTTGDILPNPDAPLQGQLLQNGQPGSAGETVVIPQGGTIDNSRGILINFNNVGIIEFIRFLSRASGRNFIFDESTLQFNVSIVSEEPTNLPNIMTALMQVLRVHGLSLMEQGNNIIIHNNKAINQVSTVVSDTMPQSITTKDSELITRVFRLNTLDPEKAAVIIAPLISEGALVEVLKETSHIVVTDLATNVRKIGQLLRSLDAPNSGLIMGQYVVVNALLDSLIDLTQKVMGPIADGKPLVILAHQPSNSIFIVSTPFLVDRTLAVLRTLDINVGQTRIFDSEALQYNPEEVIQKSKETAPAPEDEVQNVQTQQTQQIQQLQQQLQQLQQQQQIQQQQQESFVQNNGGIGGGAGGPGGGGPRGTSAGLGGPNSGVSGPFGTGPGSLERGGQRGPSGTLESGSPWSAGLPAGHIERTKFFIHKLRYRRGEQIVDALGRIGLSLQESGAGNLDLIATIQSIQWLEGSNSLVFTGTSISLAKVRELIDEIDTPLRQVFIEMLILETTLDDSLEFGVNFGSRFQGSNIAGGQSFLSSANTLSGVLDAAAVENLSTGGIDSVLDPSTLVRDLGYRLGIIGRNITHCGLEFSTIGALVKALHDKNKVEILMNPRLLVEDNATAEIFVGINTPFKTQSIANDQGSIITNNVEFRDVGTRLKVTPLISNNDIITLDILEEVSSVADTTAVTGSLSTSQLGPSTRTSKTTTRVHVPNKFFIVMSGMIQNEENRTRSQIPCLGGAPLIGGLFSEKRLAERKRNLMIFIRPQIIDTDEDIDNLTRHQQDVYRNSGRTKKMWKYEVEEALDLLNVKEPTVSLHDSEVYNP